MKTNLFFLALLSLVISCGGPTPSPVPPAPIPTPIVPPSPPPDIPQLHALGFHKTNSGHGLVNAAFKNADRVGELPVKFDWESLGFHVPVRNQGGCGSCWAFASAMTLDYAAVIFLGKSLVLSEQQIVSCDNDFGGCGGGDYAGDFMVKTGVALDSDFPYQAANLRCKSGLVSAVKGTSWSNIGAADRNPTADEIKAAIMEFGAVGVDVAATSSWDSYSGGVKQNCHGTGINHLVTATGWDDTKTSVTGKTVWHIKNSWGTNYGEAGYMWLPEGCDSVAQDAAYVQVK